MPNLQSLPLFDSLEAPEREWLRSLMREESYAAGRIIFRSGDQADALYLILEGRVAIAQDTIGRPMRRYAVLRVGDFFGEMGLLNDAGRLASARAETDVRLYRLPKDDLAQLMQRHPVVELKIRTAAIRRHHDNAARELAHGRRDDERIRVGQPVTVTVNQTQVLHLLLDNLSVRGCCLRRVPETWQVGYEFHLDLGRGAEVHLLTTDVRVVWRHLDQAGLVFLRAGPQSAVVIKRALRTLLQGR